MRELMVRYGLRPKSDRILCEIAQRFDDPSMLALFADPEQGGLDLAVYGATALFTAVDKGHFATVKYFVERGANANLGCYYKDGSGPYSMAWPAIWSGRMDMLRYLVDDHQADVDPTVEDIVKAVSMQFDEAELFLTQYECADVARKLDIPTYVALVEQEQGIRRPEGFLLMPCSTCVSPDEDGEYTSRRGPRRRRSISMFSLERR
ncbi:hypothetical protein BDW74DRAFT_158344 [Aspergillus multicolor]|uniref:uncharacterized protein n=1 Tax=Aspergillus multicolor TaxID=41759 RepID=UPI003CCE05C4